MSQLHLFTFLALFVFPASGYLLPKPVTARWVITKGCFLKVDGSTNINQFSCGIVSDYQSDTIVVSKNDAAGPLKLSGTVNLEVQKFDCHNAIMTADLRKTLKAREFPKLTIRFISLSRSPRVTDGPDLIKGMVTIELAGTSKLLEVDYKFTPNGANLLLLTGTRQVNFSDFKLVPPRKMGGMIRTNEALNVEFNLAIKILE